MKKISMMIFILFLSSPCFGDEVRSHVDARGNVTYTNSGPTIQEQQKRDVEQVNKPQVQKKVISTMPRPNRPDIHGMPPNEARTRMEGYRIEMEAYYTNQGGAVGQSGGNIISENRNLKKQSEAEDDARRSEQIRQESSNAQSNHGAIDQHGNFYAPAAGGIVDPRDGTFHQEAAGGYINTKTGEFMPAR